MARDAFRFFHRKRVRYGEIDAQAIVFNGRYLDYLDIAVTEYFRAAGMPLPPQPGGLETNVVENVVRYHKPMRLEEQIDLCVRMDRIGRTSGQIGFAFFGPDTDDPRASGHQIIVNMDATAWRPAPFPDWAVARLEAFEGRPLRTPPHEETPT